MNITKKFDRAFQWAGEKMGGEAKTNMSEDFKMLETEMALRFEGMERLQRSMNQYIKWMGRRLEPSEDREKNMPVGYLGRTMVAHGEEFQADSEFGNCLITMGRANERISAIQESFVSEATSCWLESLERSLAMMKEYQAARKKLENRRLNYDASISKLQKAKRDDFRLEEELRAAKAKYEESSEDVLRRMQDIQDSEADSTRDLTQLLDVELEYHERCAEELRRVRQNWPAGPSAGYNNNSPVERRQQTGRSRSNTAHSLTERLSLSRTNTLEAAESTTAPPVRMPIRPGNSRRQSHTHQQQQQQQQADGPIVRPTIGSKPSTSFQGGASLDRERGRVSGTSTPTAIANMSALRGQLRPVNTKLASTTSNTATTHDDVFADRDSDEGGSDAGSADWANRSTSSATSVGSLSRTPSNNAVMGGAGAVVGKKAPPPPPPSRAKKPPPPVPARRETGY